MSFLEFDPVDSAQHISDMIKNDTLIDNLDQDQLSERFKHIILNVHDSLYILKKVQLKYNVPGRFKAVRHILTAFGEGNQIDHKNFIELSEKDKDCLACHLPS